MPKDPQVTTERQILMIQMDYLVEMTLGRGKVREGMDPEADSRTEVIRVPSVRMEKTQACVWRIRRATRAQTLTARLHPAALWLTAC